MLGGSTGPAPPLLTTAVCCCCGSSADVDVEVVPVIDLDIADALSPDDLHVPHAAEASPISTSAAPNSTCGGGSSSSPSPGGRCARGVREGIAMSTTTCTLDGVVEWEVMWE
jgi:hypothetical protein